MLRRCFLLHAVAVGAVLTRARAALGHAAPASPAPEGAVIGTALGIGPSARNPTVPLAGLMLLLVPRSEALLAGLDRIRGRSRESMQAYRSAIPEMRELVEKSLQTASSAGPSGSILSTTVDAGGRFSLDGVPAGAWILIGRRGVYVDRTAVDTRKESGTYQAQPRLVGFERVTVWLQVVTVEPGQQQVVELTDRNAWFEGVEERTAARPRPSIPIPNRRSAD